MPEPSSSSADSSLERDVIFGDGAWQVTRGITWFDVEVDEELNAAEPTSVEIVAMWRIGPDQLDVATVGSKTVANIDERDAEDLAEAILTPDSDTKKLSDPSWRTTDHGYRVVTMEQPVTRLDHECFETVSVVLHGERVTYVYANGCTAAQGAMAAVHEVANSVAPAAR